MAADATARRRPRLPVPLQRRSRSRAPPGPGSEFKLSSGCRRRVARRRADAGRMARDLCGVTRSPSVTAVWPRAPGRGPRAVTVAMGSGPIGHGAGACCLIQGRGLEIPADNLANGLAFSACDASEMNYLRIISPMNQHARLGRRQAVAVAARSSSSHSLCGNPSLRLNKYISQMISIASRSLFAGAASYSPSLCAGFNAPAS